MSQEVLEGNRLWIFIPEHRTVYEGSRKKTHIGNDDGKVICGASVVLGSGSDEVTINFLNQPDPDNAMCKTCKKIAINFYNQTYKQ